MSACAMAPCTTPLQAWIAGKCGLRPGALSRDRLAAEQLRLLNETLQWARRRSAVYRVLLAHLPDAPLASLEDIRHLPFTTPDDLGRDSTRFVCVSQDEIRRVVTLQTSGTSGAPKRIFFTEADLELALDFFAHGVSTAAMPGEAMLIALPGEREDSVGALLARGIARAGVMPLPCGPFSDPAPALALLERHRPASVIGLPVPMLSLACCAEASGSAAFRDLRSIVLCSDHVSSSLVHALRGRTHAAIFEHYGMTEMGLGGGIDCEAHTGYHLRERDFLFEIVDPTSGEPVPDGFEGEIVFTTLTRRGMPLIRCRTGDLSRFLPEPCPCGTSLRRLDRVRDRTDSRVSLGGGRTTTQSALDEALFAVNGLADFTATVIFGKPALLEIAASCPWTQGQAIQAALLAALDAIPSIRSARESGDLHITSRLTRDFLQHTGPKRRIQIGGGT